MVQVVGSPVSVAYPELMVDVSMEPAEYHPFNTINVFFKLIKLDDHINSFVLVGAGQLHIHIQTMIKLHIYIQTMISKL